MGYNPGKENLRFFKMLPSVSNTTTQILGSSLKLRGQNLGYLSPIILKAKFGTLTRFQRQILGPSPLPPPNMEVPPWVRMQALCLQMC